MSTGNSRTDPSAAAPLSATGGSAASSPSRWLWLWIGLSAIYSLVVAFIPGILGMRIEAESGLKIILWPLPVTSVMAACLGVLLTSVGGIQATRCGTLWLGERREPTAAAIASPLCFLPLCFTGVFLRRYIPAELAGNLLFYIPVFLFCVVVMRAWRRLAKAFDSRPFAIRQWLVIVAGFALIYTGIGWYFTLSVGQHSGDEGHYLVQAESLHFDGDLNIRNNVAAGASDRDRLQYHISENSRGDAWCSYHPFGLSVLLAPTVGAGLLARHAVLGLISGLGLGGLFLLCRCWGARLSDALMVVVLFGLSAFWGVYSSRALPEVLGASLLLYLLVAAHVQERHAWSSVFLGAFCAGALPWAHTRFIPVSLLGVGFYGLRGLMGEETWPRKILRLAVFSILCCLGYLAYYGVENSMFVDANSYPVRKMLFTYPAGIWQILVSRCSVLYTLPSFAVFLAALVAAMFRIPGYRISAGILLGCVISVLVTACGTEAFAGGASLPGRFLFVVVPLGIAPAVALLPRVGGMAKGWLVFLSLTSCWQFIVMLFNLPEFHLTFTDPLFIATIRPEFYRLLDPYPAMSGFLSYVFPVTLYAGTGVLLAAGSLPRIASLGIIGVIAASAIWADVVKPGSSGDFINRRRDVARNMSEMNIERAYVQAWSTNQATPVFGISDRFAETLPEEFNSVTTEDLGAAATNSMLSQPRLTAGERDRHGVGWATLAMPFPAGKGPRMLRLRGRQEGAAIPVVAVREGTRTLLEWEGPTETVFDHSFAFNTHQKGDLYVLIHLKNGQGRFITESLSFTPFSDALLEKANVVIPPLSFDARASGVEPASDLEGAARVGPGIAGSIRFRKGIEFLGLTLSAKEATPGQTVDVTYFWKSPPTANPQSLVVFVHFEKNKTRFQDNHGLLTDLSPHEIHYQPFSQVLSYTHRVDVPSSLSTGDYRIIIGLLDGEGKERLKPETSLKQKHGAIELPGVLTVKPAL